MSCARACADNGPTCVGGVGPDVAAALPFAGHGASLAGVPARPRFVPLLAELTRSTTSPVASLPMLACSPAPADAVCPALLLDDLRAPMPVPPRVPPRLALPSTVTLSAPSSTVAAVLVEASCMAWASVRAPKLAGTPPPTAALSRLVLFGGLLAASRIQAGGGGISSFCITFRAGVSEDSPPGGSVGQPVTNRRNSLRSSCDIPTRTSSSMCTGLLSVTYPPPACTCAFRLSSVHSTVLAPQTRPCSSAGASMSR